MNIFKPICVILMSFMLLGSLPAAGVDYCAQKYKFVEHGTLVCYRNPLSDVQIDKLEKHLSKTVRLYPDFIKRYDISWKRPEGILAVVFFSHEEMNDPALFAELLPNYSNLPMGDVEARYFPEENILCITRAALSIRSPDLPHEAVHWLNKAAGITNKKRDESIAYAFEPYYFSHK